MSGHIQVRKGILEHVTKGWMDGDMLIAYLIILQQCDWKTGVWMGSSLRLRESVPDWSESTCGRVLQRLQKGQYIESEHIRGSRGNYPVLINNFEPTAGPNKGKRLRKTKGMDWRNAVKLDLSGLIDEGQSGRTGEFTVVKGASSDSHV